MDFDRLPRVHQAELGECSDTEGGGQLGAILEGHALSCVLAVEAVPGPATKATATRPAWSAPGDDHHVARSDIGHAIADGLDASRGLVTKQEWKIVADPTLAVVQVGMADTTRLYSNQHLVRPRVRNANGHDLDRSAAFPGDDALNLM
jgi:hypothetical protein